MDGSMFTIGIVLGLLFYVLFIYLVAKFGERKSLGFTWTLILAIFFSPLLAFIVAAVSGKKG